MPFYSATVFAVPPVASYLLLAQDSHFVTDLKLRVLYQGKHSGTILAEP